MDKKKCPWFSSIWLTERFGTKSWFSGRWTTRLLSNQITPKSSRLWRGGERGWEISYLREKKKSKMVFNTDPGISPWFLPTAFHVVLCGLYDMPDSWSLEKLTPPTIKTDSVPSYTSKATQNFLFFKNGELHVLQAFPILPLDKLSLSMLIKLWNVLLIKKKMGDTPQERLCKALC